MARGNGRWIAAAALAAGAALLAACGGEPEQAAGPAPPSPIPAGFLLAADPGGARDAGAVKKDAKEGDTVVVRGRVGGSTKPFVDGRAVMTIVDPAAVTSCADMDMGEEGCETPWDYCCTPVEVLRANTVTVEVDGPDGRPLAAGLDGWGGIAPLKTVVVQGVVGPRPEPGVLVVRATGIFVEAAKR